MKGIQSNGSLFSEEAYCSAMQFAAEKHYGQVYFAGMGVPYICHLALVCCVVMAALQAEPAGDPDLAVQCALLHDTLEDTRATFTVLEQNFGKAVAEGVQALTKDHSLPVTDRLPDSLSRIQLQPCEVGMVKLADRICNLCNPPLDWTNARRKAYLADARDIHRILGEASPFLYGVLGRRMQVYQKNYVVETTA